jgi:ribosomal protein L15
VSDRLAVNASRVVFTGGQQPQYRRAPKWPGRPMGPGHKRTEYALIQVEVSRAEAPFITRIVCFTLTMLEYLRAHD